MSFANRSERPRQPPARRRIARPSAALGVIVRTAVFGLVAIAGASGALVRHCTHTPLPMRVPVPRAAPTYDADAGEIPVPDSLFEDGG